MYTYYSTNISSSSRTRSMYTVHVPPFFLCLCSFCRMIIINALRIQESVCDLLMYIYLALGLSGIRRIVIPYHDLRAYKYPSLPMDIALGFKLRALELSHRKYASSRNHHPSFASNCIRSGGGTTAAVR
jgi:hypothetical protein